MKPIVRATCLGKQYLIGSREAAYDTLRDWIGRAVGASLQHLGGIHRKPVVHIWALKDASFDIKPGEVVGIIGRNGAGKSTLLKLLSRITNPTTGRVELYGRVASLLEVGTGFHPELSGRENIYLNGAILGMKKTEIDTKFDQIVDFCELERFLDTPVKRYSSGMYMRLAFAVASHLEPEILIVDEVLAVGDAHFQKKCLGKMGDVAVQGRTVLLVSHNMLAIQSLCKRALWLDQGGIAEDGVASTVIAEYLKHSFGDNISEEEKWPDPENAPGNESVRLHRVMITKTGEGSPQQLLTKTPFLIEVEYWNLQPGANITITIHVHTEPDVVAFTSGSGSGDPRWSRRPLPAGLFRSTCYIPGKLLNVGRHRLTVLVIKDLSSVIFRHESALTFEIFDLEARVISHYVREPGVVKPDLRWKTEQLAKVVKVLDHDEKL